MEHERWADVEEMLIAALAVDNSARAAFLAQITNAEVRREVDSLLFQSGGASDSTIQAAISASVGDAEVVAGPPSFPERFRVMRQVGEGGMGRVFEAVDLHQNAHVALKSLRTLSPEHIYAFKQEFRALTGLVHSNLVTLYDLVQHRGGYFLSMEFIDGAPLLEYVRSSPDRLGLTGESPACDLQRLRKAMLQVAEGLTALHSAGKLHRDLKPSNVLVREDGHAVILDFGLVIDLRFEAAGSRMRQVQGGTAAYMAPEQMHGTASAASDWYSFGVMLFEALTGTTPFRGSWADIAAAHKSGKVVTPSALIDGCPDDLNLLCSRLVCSEASTRPAPEEVLRLLGAPLHSSCTAVTSAEVFVNRVKELGELNSAYARLKDSQVGLVTVSGAAGTGKSALAQKFLQGIAAHPDTIVLSGRCFEHDGLPFRGADALVDQLSRFLLTGPISLDCLNRQDAVCLAAVFPVIAAVPLFADALRTEPVTLDAVELRRRATASLRELLLVLGQCLRLVIWLDDLHWIDQDSAELLSQILRGPHHPILLLVCTFRIESHPAMRFLLDALQANKVPATPIDLGPLTPDDAVRLAESCLDPRLHSLRERASAIARDSGGLPIFVRELARASTQAVDGLSLSAVVRSRVQNLDEESRTFLNLVALAGQPLVQELVFTAAKLNSRSPKMLNNLTQMGLVRTGPTGGVQTVQAYHDRIREAIASAIHGEEKQSLHRALAQALQTTPEADVEMVAYHLERCGELHQAAVFYERAADTAAAGVAFNTAAQLFRRALEIGHFSASARARVELRLADVLANGGKSADASRHYAAAALHLPSDERLQIEGLAVYHLCVGGHLDEGRLEINRLLKEIGFRPLGGGPRGVMRVLYQDLRCRWRGTSQQPTNPDEIDPMLLAKVDLLWFAAAGLGTSDMLGGFYLLQLSMELAQLAREPSRMIRAYSWYAAMQVGRRSADSHIDSVFSRCRELSKHIGDPPASRATLALASGIRHYLLGAWQDALPHCLESENILLRECRGMNWELAFARGLKLTLLMNTGVIHGLENEARALLEDAVSRDDLATATTIASFPLPYCQLVTGRPALARNAWRAWVDRWPPYLVKSNQEPYAVLIELWSYLYESDTDAAFKLLSRQWKPVVVRSHAMRVPVASVYFLETRARILIAAAENTVGRSRRKLIGEAGQIAAKLRTSRAKHGGAHAALIDALLNAANSFRSQAISDMGEAAGKFAECQMSLHAAAAQLRVGQWMGEKSGIFKREEAVLTLRSKGIPNPEAVANMLVG